MHDPLHPGGGPFTPGNTGDTTHSPGDSPLSLVNPSSNFPDLHAMVGGMHISEFAASNPGLHLGVDHHLQATANPTMLLGGSMGNGPSIHMVPLQPNLAPGVDNDTSNGLAI